MFLVALMVVAGCSKKEEAPAQGSTAVQPTTPAATTPAPKPAAEEPKGPSATEDKEFLGLNLPAHGKWKPVWDADAKVAKWEGGDEYFSAIVIRIVKEKIENIEDLKNEAPMMMQLGTAITKVVEEKKTDKGWYAIVERDKVTDLVYMRKLGRLTVCSANISKQDLGKSITKEEAIKACESYTVK
jgi:hypothetical protein